MTVKGRTFFYLNEYGLTNSIFSAAGQRVSYVRKILSETENGPWKIIQAVADEISYVTSAGGRRIAVRGRRPIGPRRAHYAKRGLVKCGIGIRIA